MCTSLNEEGFDAEKLCYWELGACDRVCRFILSKFHCKDNFPSSSLVSTFPLHLVYVNNFYLNFSSLFRSLSDKCVQSRKKVHHLCLSRHQLLLASRYRFLLVHGDCSNCSGLVIL